MALTNFFSSFVIQIVGNLLLLAGVMVVLALQVWQAGLALALLHHRRPLARAEAAPHRDGQTGPGHAA